VLIHTLKPKQKKRETKEKCTGCCTTARLFSPHCLEGLHAPYIYKLAHTNQPQASDMAAATECVFSFLLPLRRSASPSQASKSLLFSDDLHLQVV
jgi:hypothetical protein